MSQQSQTSQFYQNLVLIIIIVIVIIIIVTTIIITIIIIFISACVLPDMPTRTANQKRVSQAGGYCKQSFHFSTPVNSSTDKPAQRRMSEYAGNCITARQVWAWLYARMTGLQMLHRTSDTVSAQNGASEPMSCM